MELQDAIQQLREELRNERRTSAFQGDRSIGEGSRGSNASIRSNSEDIGTDTTEAFGNTKTTYSDNRGIEVKPKRSRQNRRRPIDNSSSFTEGSSEIGRVGLERADDETLFSAQQTLNRGQIGNTLGTIKNALLRGKKGILTDKEAKEYKEPLKVAIQSMGEIGDKALAWKSRRDVEIWGNITDLEADALASILIKRGQRNTYAADVVRKIINGEDYATVAAMFVPRFIYTVELLRSTR